MLLLYFVSVLAWKRIDIPVFGNLLQYNYVIVNSTNVYCNGGNINPIIIPYASEPLVSLSKYLHNLTIEPPETAGQYIIAVNGSGCTVDSEIIVPEPSCTLEKFQVFQQHYKSFVSALPHANTPSHMNYLISLLESLLVSNIYQACKNLLEEISISSPTSFSKQCTNVNSSSFTDLNFEKVTEKCSLFDTSSLIALRNVAEKFTSTIKTCKQDIVKQASTSKIFNVDMFWIDYSNQFKYCKTKLFGTLISGTYQPSQCRSDMDCLTSCINQKCVIPTTDPIPFLIPCLLKDTSVHFRSAFARLVGSPSQEDTSIIIRSLQQSGVATLQCIGPTGYKFNGGWYISTGSQPQPVSFDENGFPQFSYDDYLLIGQQWLPCPWSNTDDIITKCFYLPPNSSFCLNELTCNSNNCTLQNSSFCGDCRNGAKCLEISNPESCCIGDSCTETSFQDCTANCFSGPNPSLEQGCINPAMKDLDCMQAGITATFADGIYSRIFTARMINVTNTITGISKKICRLYNDDDATTCDGKSPWGFSWRPLSAAPADVMNEQNQQCSKSICYNTSLSKNECEEIPNAKWNQRLNGGNGYCEGFMVPCIWSFYQGALYTPSRRMDEESCNNGFCDAFPNADSCTVAKCSSKCFYCASSRRICYHTNQTSCLADGAAWTTISGVSLCLYNDTRQCLKTNGASIASCETFGKDKCVTNPFQSLLACSLIETDCLDSDSCINNGARCNNNELNVNGTWYFYNNYSVISPVPDEYGFPLCNIGTMGKIGCILNVDNSTCNQMGGDWIIPTLNDCADLTKCVPDPDNCLQCKKVPIYSVANGVWKTSSSIRGSWLTRKMVSQNQLQSTVSVDTVHTLFNQAVGIYLGTLKKQEFQCLYADFIEYFRYSACICNNFVSSMNCHIKLMDRAILMADNALVCDESKIYYSDSLVMPMFSSSCTPTQTSSLFSFPVFPFGNYLENSFYKRDDIMSKSNCYSTVVNPLGSFVGQILGDCVFIRGQIVSICLAINPAIEYDSTKYPNYGIVNYGFDENGKETFVYNVNIVPNFDNGRLCFLVRVPAIYCPGSDLLIIAAVTPDAQFSVAEPKPSCKVSIPQNFSTQHIDTISLNASRYSIEPGQSLLIDVQLESTNTTPTSNIPVYLSILSKEASIIGQTTSYSVNGIARFMFSIDKVGTFQLRAICGKLTLPFSVEVLFPSHISGLRFVSLPPDRAIISIVDVFGNVVSVNGLQISLSCSIACSVTMLSMVEGYATFEIIFHESGLAYLVARYNDYTVRSESFPVTTENFFQLEMKDSIIAYATQPLSVAVYTNTSIGPIQVSLNSSFIPLLESTINGIATFSIVFQKSGNYTIEARSPGIRSCRSSVLVLGPAYLIFDDIGTQILNTPFQVKITLKNSFNETYGEVSEYITLGIQRGSGSPGALIVGIQRVKVVNGVAVFKVQVSQTGKNFIFEAISDSGIIGQSLFFNVIKEPPSMPPVKYFAVQLLESTGYSPMHIYQGVTTLCIVFSIVVPTVVLYRYHRIRQFQKRRRKMANNIPMQPMA